MKITVDYGRCTGLGICESLAPRYFEVNDDGNLVLLEAELDEADLTDVQDAIAGCPTEALRLTKD